MKKCCSLIVMTVLHVALLAGAGCVSPDLGETPRSEGPGSYFDGTPPATPEIFAPGVVSSPLYEHSGAVFTPDGSELFWSVVVNEGREPRLVLVLHMWRNEGRWHGPELAPFNRGSYTHVNSISPDGERLYVYTALDGRKATTAVIDKTEHGWSDPRPLRLTDVDNPGTHVNEVHEAEGGTLYMSGPAPGLPQGRGIVRARRVGGEYQEYEPLGPTVNSTHSDWFPNHSPAIDPEERFIVFASTRPGGHSEQDLYIAYRQADGTFGPAVNLGPEINGVGTRQSWPQLSPDGSALFFVSTVPAHDAFDPATTTHEELLSAQRSAHNGWANIYWVDTSFVERLRPAGEP